jgi:hypothetical protein
MAKIIVAFRNSANAPKKKILSALSLTMPKNKAEANMKTYELLTYGDLSYSINYFVKMC